MKNLFFLLLSCITLLGCSNDDTVALHQPERYLETGTFKIRYNGETLNLKNVRISKGGPDSGYDLELSSVILYDDVHATKYSLVLVFNKNDLGEYVLYTITLGVDDRQGENSFYLKGYYAYTSGQFEVPGFIHDTKSVQNTESITVSGNFKGTLLPGNGQPEPIEIEYGKFWANFESEQ